jgi:hypothetical protein
MAFALGFMRMHADGAEDIVKAFGDRQDSVEGADFRAYREHPANARIARTLDHLFQIALETVKVEMTV